MWKIFLLDKNIASAIIFNYVFRHACVLGCKHNLIEKKHAVFTKSLSAHQIVLLERASPDFVKKATINKLKIKICKNIDNILNNFWT